MSELYPVFDFAAKEGPILANQIVANAWAHALVWLFVSGVSMAIAGYWFPTTWRAFWATKPTSDEVESLFLTLMLEGAALVIASIAAAVSVHQLIDVATAPHLVVIRTILATL